jgi:hypothetical protein
MTKNIMLRRNGRSLGMTVPMEFVRALGLQPGDLASWESDGDVATLKFFKVTEHRTPASEAQGEEVSADTA